MSFQNHVEKLATKPWLVELLTFSVVALLTFGLLFATAPPRSAHAEEVNVNVGQAPSTGIISTEVLSVAQVGAEATGDYRIMYRVLGAIEVTLVVDGNTQQTVSVTPNSWQTLVFDVTFTQEGVHNVRIDATNGDAADDVSSSISIMYTAPETPPVDPVDPTDPTDPTEPVTPTNPTQPSNPSTPVTGGGSTNTPAPTAPMPIEYRVVRGSTELGKAPVIPKKPTFEGTAPAGTRIVVTVFSDPVRCETIARGDNTWSCTLESELPIGSHKVYIEATRPGQMTESYGPFAVKVEENEDALPPVEETPAPTQGNNQENNTVETEKTTLPIAWPLLALFGVVLFGAWFLAKRQANKRAAKKSKKKRKE